MEFGEVINRLKSNKLFLPAVGIGVAAGAFALYKSRGEGGEGGFLSSSDNGGAIGDIPEISVPENIGSGGGGGSAGDTPNFPALDDIGGGYLEDSGSGGGYIDIPFGDIFGSGGDYGGVYPDNGSTPYLDTFMSEMRDMVSGIPYIPEQLGYNSPDIPEIDYSPAPSVKALKERVTSTAKTSIPKLTLNPSSLGGGARVSSTAIQNSINKLKGNIKSTSSNIIKPKAPTKSPVSSVRTMVKAAKPTPKFSVPKAVSKQVSNVKKAVQPKQKVK